MASSWGGKHALKIDSPAAMAKLAIDRASIVFGKKSGDFHSKSGEREIFIFFIKNREISRKIGRLGSSAYAQHHIQG